MCKKKRGNIHCKLVGSVNRCHHNEEITLRGKVTTLGQICCEVSRIKIKTFLKVFSIFQVFKQFDIVGKKVDNFEFLLYI